MLQKNVPLPTDLLQTLAYCVPDGRGGMVHTGLPVFWVGIVLVFMVLIALYAIRTPYPSNRNAPRLFPLHTLPVFGPIIRFMTASPWPLTGLRTLALLLFILVVYAGLWGTPLPERNLATTLTWTVWWSLVVISVFFLGTAWCSICPWDTLAGWIVRQRLWKRPAEPPGFEWQPPRFLRTVWPALLLFVGLTWLELGMGVTSQPRITAILALLMVILAVLFMAFYKRNRFCRSVCPIGRTLGVYAQLAPIALRPIDPSLCATCQTLECYHGSETIEPCPTGLTMGRFSQNTYCTSCGSCVLSCPHHNVSWFLRPLASEASVDARPHWDESWFMLSLLSLTAFHGITMLPQWELYLQTFARIFGDTGGFLVGFSVGMGLCLLSPLLLYGIVIQITRRLGGNRETFKHCFSRFAFATLPVAFAYHMAHNLVHFSREGRGLGDVWRNPLGQQTIPMGNMEKYLRLMNPLLSEEFLHAIQAGLLCLGFWLAVQILRSRGQASGDGYGVQGSRLLPLVLFVGGLSGFNVWLLAQAMVMRL